MEYNYSTATSRNLGWVTEQEQQSLKSKTVAIAGMGGVGGHHAINLARLGIGRFHLSDFDVFDVANFNRQSGADMTTVGRKKLEVMKERVLAINPEAQIKVFPTGVTKSNMNEFLDGVDLFVDGLDIYALDIRAEVFQACWNRRIPACTVGPIAMGAAMMNFLPGKMSFADYFGYTGKSDTEKVLHFVCGLTPSFLHLPSLVDRSRLNLAAKKGPSTSMGCYLAAGVMGTEVLKILLNRGSISCAPVGYHFDAYTNRYRKTWMPFGYRNPFFQLKLAIVRKIASRSATNATEIR
jgi:molybdopterin/thiamine biosynthesis adenylyltransferase